MPSHGFRQIDPLFFTSSKCSRKRSPNLRPDFPMKSLLMLCTDVETEPVLQEITGEELNRGANKASDARLDVHARGFWDRQQSAFFDVQVCHPKRGFESRTVSETDIPTT